MQNWKRIVYTIAAIQIGTGISIIGVVAFIPLFLTSELGVTDPGEAAFWAGLISGVTPFFVAIAPVKEPFSWPKSSLSRSVPTIDEQFMARNGASFTGL